ncbi:DegT/DnrJ/EryC1/StrS family aminotransferase [Geotalea uraniireducens]|uniref:DegT/DnrJ/EryC1/StrS aminotransferase n=1 Tax=Geotalea uraniireducens (strain Rf4) TaxID=351605 RepID=A5G404_GEOUR|nr:DegT/DnrJ/EryC1/StrS family aminotransferase [Geotalea uraniireducens]ABQ26522.1 DegT/DnrJ/EryC1/StrS aminotransferase [Geotalea uraniireducens Rf4]
MAMHIGRTLPPAAAPLHFKDIISGWAGLFEGVITVGRFEEELKEVYGVRHCFAVSSGKAALVLILQALNELSPERDEVLIPAYTCYSVPSAIVRAGLKVRLCDLASGTLDFDFDRLEEQLENPRILCVIPTHLFGLPADAERVKRLVNHRGIFVVEDAAQAMGAEWNGKKMGTLGDVGLFSMGRGKAFSTVEGGIILTDNDLIGRAIEKRMGAIAGYGAFDCLKVILYAVALSLLIHPWVYWLPKSLPFLKLGETHFDPSFPIRRLSSFQAGVAKGWKKKIGELKEVRLKNARKIAGYGITLPAVLGAVIPGLIRYPVLLADVETKKKILRISESMGLGISGGYPDSIDGIAKLAYLSNGNSFPVAKDIAERIVALPVHPFVSDCDIQKIGPLLI